MTTDKPERAVIYARLSVASRDESVSIARQVRACRAYARRRGWEVVDEYVDDGVSATNIRPKDRLAWQALLNRGGYDAVIVWKTDRLARSTLDFLTAHTDLQEREAGLVAVEDPIDMTTPAGRAFATVLAVFAEMEAAAIRARVKAARDYLIREGRVVGGTIPYGWRSVNNPDGPGKVLAKDPDRIEWVSGMVSRASAGGSIYSIKRWLDKSGAPLPEASQKTRTTATWTYSTVERLLHNPVLAGMTPYDPGRGRRGVTDPHAVLRDEQGMPIVDASVAILSLEDREALLRVLAERDSPQRRPRASKNASSPLMSRLATCGHCDRLMHRASAHSTAGGRPTLQCPGCKQTVSRKQLDELVIQMLLHDRGDLMCFEQIDYPLHPSSPDMAALDEAIAHAAHELTQDNIDEQLVMSRLNELKERRARARIGSRGGAAFRVTGQTVREAWHAATDDLGRREVFAGQCRSLRIVRGGVGRYLDPERVTIEWQPVEAGMALPDGTRVLDRIGGDPEGEGGLSNFTSVLLPSGDRIVLGPPGWATRQVDVPQ